LFKFPPHPTSAIALPGENCPSKSCVEMNEKTSVNYIYPDLWPPTASQLQGLTVYQMTFRNVYKFKKWLVTGLVWSRTIDAAVNESGECLHACVRTMCPYFKQFCCRPL